jgi:hypothetical protein
MLFQIMPIIRSGIGRGFNRAAIISYKTPPPSGPINCIDTTATLCYFGVIFKLKESNLYHTGVFMKAILNLNSISGGVTTETSARLFANESISCGSFKICYHGNGLYSAYRGNKFLSSCTVTESYDSHEVMSMLTYGDIATIAVARPGNFSKDCIFVIAESEE